MKEVQVINPKLSKKIDDILRVAAYCRVSTDSDDQMNSFIAQVKYYNDFISRNKNMVLVDIYADEGITGTCAEKREKESVAGSCGSSILINMGRNIRC